LNQTDGVPAALIPGIPFREKAELPKTLPNGTSVDSGVGSGDLGFGKTRPGPNHMGIDLKGNEIRNQLNDALNLKEGASAQDPQAPSGGTVNHTGLAGKPGTSSGNSAIASPRNKPTYEGGLARPGLGLISAEGGQTTKDDLQGLLPNIFGGGKKETGTKEDIEGKKKAVMDGKTEEQLAKDKKAQQEWEKKFKTDGGTKEYTNPDAPSGTTPVTEEQLEKVAVRFSANTQPGVEEHLQEVDASMVSGTDPRRNLISNPNPEDQSTGTSSGDPQKILDAKGPDTVNPNDPEVGGGSTPPEFDPNRPK
jgi:hypothetical protein